MTGTEWEHELNKVPTPRLLDAETAHEIEVSNILTCLSLERTANGLDDLLRGFDRT